MEVPTTPGPSGLKLSGIKPEDNEQFLTVVKKLGDYSQNLVKAFDEITQKLHNKLNENGGIALKALQTLGKSIEELDISTTKSQEQLDSIVSEIESILSEFSGLDAIQNEILLLSDLLTAVEEAVKNQS